HLITRHGARRLLLTSRRGPAADGATNLAEELTALGAQVEIAACDTSDPQALATLLAGRTLTAVIHAAGTLDDATLQALTPRHLDAVLCPKADAAWHLHQLTRGQDLAAFVFFSSIAGTLGTPGQANYAAASAFLDALARHRQTDGLPATSLAWGLWATTSGMTASMTTADRQRLNSLGIQPLTTSEALTLLDEALGRLPVFAAAIHLPTGLAHQQTTGTRAPHPMLRGLLRSPLRRAAHAGPDTPSLSHRLASLPADQQHRLLTELVQAGIATVLGRASAQEIDPQRPFKELGFDSLTAVELRNRLNTATGLRLRTSLIFDHPTPEAVTRHLLTRIAPARATPVPELEQLEAALSTAVVDDEQHSRIASRLQNLLWKWNAGQTMAAGPADTGTERLESATDEELFAELDNTRGTFPPSRSADLHATRQRLLALESGERELVAVVGMGCRFPGGVGSPEDLWRLVADGVDAVGDFPTDRGWDLDALYDPDPDHPGTSYTQRGGFLKDAGGFDADFFGISPREAEAIDPQQRLLLETAWEAIERAGIDPETLRGSQAGVYTGVIAQEYGPRLAQPAGGAGGYLLTGSAPSVASGRLSYILGLEGPAVTVDTACSSSLVAVHLACQALRNGECTLALAGGVTVMASPGMFLEFSRQRGLAPDGRCKSFSAGADGMGLAEGAGLVVLEKLPDAQRHGHQVLAVIRGSAVNQDGASNGLTAPSGPAQERVIRQALASARIAPSGIDAVEAHGTGTTVGDSIEVQALQATYGQDRPSGQPLYLGSVKSNIGHTQAAAGIAGLIKMICALRQATLPHTLHAGEPTPHIDWSARTIKLLNENTPWPKTAHPRCCGLTAFGISGTNAHLILAEAPGPATSPDPPPPLNHRLPVLVSARSRAALAAQAQQLASHLDN
ncbi:MAG: beta-ketoacyl synthase N-terminal-like domain-containing protein, partial [Streptosporangiaceae bacterium]